MNLRNVYTGNTQENVSSAVKANTLAETDRPLRTSQRRTGRLSEHKIGKEGSGEREKRKVIQVARMA